MFILNEDNMHDYCIFVICLCINLVKKSYVNHMSVSKGYSDLKIPAYYRICLFSIPNVSFPVSIKYKEYVMAWTRRLTIPQNKVFISRFVHTSPTQEDTLSGQFLKSYLNRLLILNSVIALAVSSFLINS